MILKIILSYILEPSRLHWTSGVDCSSDPLASAFELEDEDYSAIGSFQSNSTMAEPYMVVVVTIVPII
ncbi:MAG TPA: hypothetical protein VE089_00530 [Nitrososphaeraceae archaeon]|nr:hypothetical protein [Nitrososphaeraceae archaeon]